MTYLESQENKTVDRFGRTSYHLVHVLSCDACQRVFSVRGSSVRLKSRKSHTCSPECKRTAQSGNGAIAATRSMTNIERYGTANTFAAEPCKQKLRETWRAKYGTDHARSSDAVKEKVRQTMLARYGVDNPFCSDELKKKARQTHLKNYGVEFAMQRPEVQEALREGCRKKYGVDYVMQSPEVREKMLETRLRDGTIYKSKPEDKLYSDLVKTFGEHDVSRQVRVTPHWIVDFYISSIDTYVQLDGVYWHGLDRPIEVIRESGMRGHVRDMAIYRKWNVDRQQEKWFSEEGKRLVRVTDVEYKRDPSACLSKIGVT